MGRQEQSRGDEQWRRAADQRWRSVTVSCRWALTPWRAVTGWLEQTGTWQWRAAALVGCRRVGTGGDGTVGVGAAKGSDGGIQTSDDGEQQGGAVTVARMRAEAMGRRLLPSVTSNRSSPPAGSCRPITRPSPLVGSPLSPPVTTSRPVTSAPSPPTWHRVWTVTANCMTIGGLACFWPPTASPATWL